MNASDVVHRYLAAFAEGDPDEIAGHVTETFVNEHLAELGDGCIGREEYRRRLPGFLSAFSGARYTPVDVVEATGDTSQHVVVRYRFEADHDGHPVDLHGVMWFEVRGGLIARRTDLWDSLTFLRQTGQDGQAGQDGQDGQDEQDGG
jgi:ketosteroid isomerase-like protein